VSAPSWADLEDLFCEALTREPAERAAFLAERCAGRRDLQAEVEALLRAHDGAAGALEAPSVAAQSRLNPGERLGPYTVVAVLGAGGMGEVYRARDTKLGRDVAIKILPRIFNSDPERLARFEREARVLASLNHSHIGAIYGLEDVDGIPALVLELIDGVTLADRLATGPLPVREALTIAVQIADALDAAHEKGIVHRDLKPANVKITPEGMVKVLDFGLAKAAAGDSGAGVTQSPTVTVGATREGAIFGTAAYMSPEQAAGKPADKRSDLWAFGIVLFEMLTARPVFAGETMSHVLAAVLTTEPDWTTLPAETPAPIRRLLRRCLEKDRKRRLESAADARLDIDDALAAPPAGGRVVARPRPTWQHWSIAATVLMVAVVAGASVWIAMRPADPVPPRVSRLPLTPSAAAALSIDRVERDLAITPDGSRIVYVGNRGTQLFVRALDALAPVAVFTGAPRGPFVSPDGQWIGFVDGPSVLKKVAVTGGPAVTVATLDGNSRGAAWGPDDTIIFATIAGATGLLRVDAAGGPVTVLTRPDRAQGERDHILPEVLPDGRAVLFTIMPLTGGLDAAQVAVLDLQTGTRTILVRGTHAHYVPTGHLVYAAAGTLRAVPFDLASLKTRGTPVPVIPDVVTTGDGAVDAVVARDGTLAYVSGAGGPARLNTLVWVDRQGRETPIPAPPHAYFHPRLSPDGTRAAVFAGDQESDIWLWDLGRTTLIRVTFDPGQDPYPVWTPDGHRLIFSSERAGTRNLYWQAADGTGAVERLTDSPNAQVPTAVSPDGSRLIFTETGPKTGDDVMEIQLDGTHRVRPLMQSSFIERNGIVSPDGRWLAYEANDSGRVEISVRPFPDVNSGHWQVSTAGGTRPLWARSGQELFYVSPTGALMRVGVERSASWSATTPTLLVKQPHDSALVGRSYDVSPDGQRFLMINEGGGTDQTAAPLQIIVVQHWIEELKRLVPR
jgi:eukaryotic-like serine/threonine-protein kinase